MAIKTAVFQAKEQPTPEFSAFEQTWAFTVTHHLGVKFDLTIEEVKEIPGIVDESLSIAVKARTPCCYAEAVNDAKWQCSFCGQAVHMLYGFAPKIFTWNHSKWHAYTHVSFYWETLCNDYGINALASAFEAQTFTEALQQLLFIIFPQVQALASGEKYELKDQFLMRS